MRHRAIYSTKPLQLNPSLSVVHKVMFDCAYAGITVVHHAFGFCVARFGSRGLYFFLVRKGDKKSKVGITVAVATVFCLFMGAALVTGVDRRRV